MAGETLLLVDDDATLLRFLTEYLEREGFGVRSADRGQVALRLFYESRPDIVVLDVMMPGMDGWEVCARLRELADTPVILLTGKTSEADKLRGFRLGVDDYITKPFSLAELGARLRAVLARTAGRRTEQAAALQVGALRVDLGRREVTLDGQALDLTPTEFRLLACLAAHPGQAVAQADLVKEAWGGLRQETGSALRRYIWFLRQKIEVDPNSPQRLQTVRGFGYRLEP
jgi:two-component system KDP operon response regulator KdpE